MAKHNEPSSDSTMEGVEVRGEKAVEYVESHRQTPSGTPSLQQDIEAEWDTHPQNPYNWSRKRHVIQVAMMSAAAFTASIGTSLPSSSVFQLRKEFGIDTTQAILPLSMYVFALGLGPVLGGPLSETVGRYPVYLFSTPLGAIFTLGAGLTHNFGALAFLRFMAGLCFSPSLAIATGSINDTFKPIDRALPSVIFILMPFLGPGLGPIMGSFVTERKGWRWTQWTLIFFAIASLILCLFAEETFHTILKRRHLKGANLPIADKLPFKYRLRAFLTVSLLRPLEMLLLEPIVGLICLYVACEFATLFSFFAAVPYVFANVYNFTLEQQGLVFVSIVIGCVLGAITVMLCNALLYLPQTKKHPLHQTPPEHRLYPAMIGSIGLPLGLFWFGWTAREDISWASPAAAIIPFAWGNLCLFISTIQYLVDSYHGSIVASAGSANSLARYMLAGAFPLFTVQMYSTLGIGWASSVFGFIAIALLPVPWAFYRWGESLRQKSRYRVSDI